VEPNELKAEAAQRAAVCQCSRAQVEGRHGERLLRHPPRRGRAPRKRACLRAGQHFCRTRADGTTAAARFFGQ
jgi:hypothetical protein